MVYSRALQPGIYGSASILLLLSTLKGTAWGRGNSDLPAALPHFPIHERDLPLVRGTGLFRAIECCGARPLFASLIYLRAIFLVRLLSKFLKLSQWFSPLRVLSFIKQLLISNERREQCFSESIGCRLSC